MREGFGNTKCELEYKGYVETAYHTGRGMRVGCGLCRSRGFYVRRGESQKTNLEV